MIEKEMGNRGSKPVIVNTTRRVTVKEQRVDGSWFNFIDMVNKLNLRCTLMGFERNYQTRIPSNQINNRRLTRSYSFKATQQ